MCVCVCVHACVCVCAHACVCVCADQLSLPSVIFENDNFTPLTVDTEDQYHGIVELFPYEDISLSRAEFPKSFPFSGFVLQIYKQV